MRLMRYSTIKKREDFKLVNIDLFDVDINELDGKSVVTLTNGGFAGYFVVKGGKLYCTTGVDRGYEVGEKDFLYRLHPSELYVLYTTSKDRLVILE